MNEYGNFMDNFGVQYQKVNIMSNGLCGYSSIAYCVSGNPRGYVSVIDDSFTAFELNQELFLQQTDVGQATSLTVYREKMQIALQNVQTGEPLPQVLWMEDGHLVVYSLMFDISIFVYNTILREWYVYNDKGELGYICLAFSGSHYDVLIGLSDAPPIPKQVKRRGLDRNCLNWNEVLVDPQRYSFDFVWKWPTGKAEMHVINEITLPPKNQTFVKNIKEVSVLSSFTDICGTRYKKLNVTRDGLCGYSCIADAVFGDPCKYPAVIEDCLNAFELNPTLYNQQTEMGTDVEFHDYRQIMKTCVPDMQTGGSFPKRLWCEDGHLVIFSLMYDVSIYVYNVILHEWYVYNDSGNRGFICLNFDGTHYDCLLGMSNTRVPVIPQKVQRQGPNRRCFNWNEVPLDMERYSFAHVWKWPSGMPAIITNKVGTASPIPQTSDVCSNVSAMKKTGEALICAVCGWVSKKRSKAALHLHNMRCHRQSTEVRMQADDIVSDSVVELPLTTVNDSKQKIIAHAYSDDESMCGVSQQSIVETTDSDCSISSTRSTRSGCTLPADSSGCFKMPLEKVSKEMCKGCGRTFKQLRKHLKFCKQILSSTLESHTNSESENESCAALNTLNVEKNHGKKHEKKQQCLTCFLYFVNLSQHKRCAKATGYEKRSRERKLESESVSIIPSVTNQDRDHSSRASSVSSQSSMRSTRSQTRASQSMQGEFSQSELSDSLNLSDASELLQNFATDSKSIGQNSSDNMVSSKYTQSCKEMNENIEAVGYRKRMVSNKTRVLICTVCTKKCRTKSSLKRHRLTDHGNNVPVIESASKEVLNSDGKVIVSSTDETPENFTQSGKTRKDHLASDFKIKLAKLKKKYLSSEVVQIDPLYDALKLYQQDLVSKTNNVTTERLTDEILDVVLNPDVIGDEREFAWSPAEQQRLNELNIECKELKKRRDWYWDPEPNSNQAIYNNKRLELCMNEELAYTIVHCKQCQTDSLMMGVDQLRVSDCCYECLSLQSRKKELAKDKEKKSQWEKVRPTSRQYPKRTEVGRTHEDLPDLYPGDKAVIALVHPVVTVKKTYFRNKKLRQESISLLGEPDKTWVKVLPREDLKERFFVLERTGKNGNMKHIVANRDRVEQWLKYLFINHREYKRRLESGELEISTEALDSLERQSELASVDTADGEDDMSADAATEYGMIQPALESGFVDHHILAFDKFPNLYLKRQDILKIRQAGKIEIITDDCKRRQIYNASANLSFPHLFPHGEMSPTDFGSYTLAKDLLKKQMMFAYKDSCGKLRWIYADEDIYMMHQYARLTEMRVHARVGFYISQHPSAAHLPLDSVVNAFKNGFDEMGLLDARLPDLTMLMTQLPNSRQYWFQERQALETIARDLSDPNLFMTINPEPRHSADIRQLIHSLHCPNEPFDREWTFSSTEQFTELMSKYAPHVSVYLWRKTKIFMRAFLNDICRIPATEQSEDWTTIDRSKNGYYWFRSEFTETRGFPHFHFMVRLPNTLEAGALGRLTHNMRVIRTELKCGNIKPSMKETAWEMIRFGLLASRYLVLLADSVSSASFYTERVGSFDAPDPSKLIDVNGLRAEFEVRCKTGTHTVATHPLMRKFDDAECDPNPLIDYAQVVAATCIHHCLTNGGCGGDPKTSKGCRFSYPKKLMNYTVPAMMHVNSQQAEVTMLLRRTNARVCTSNFYITRYLRCNNDLQLIPDPATSLRYCTKYCTKSAKHDVLLNEMVDHINSRSNDMMQPITVKQALSHLILADCSHRAFMSKHELSWNVMGLPSVSKSFSKVGTVAFHPRANLFQSYDDENVIEYSDRTEYTAYAERCNQSTKIKLPRSMKATDAAQLYEEVAKMSLREFAERITHTWKLKAGFSAHEIGAQCRRKFTNRDINSGHWVLSYNNTRKHIRSSIRLYTRPAIEYESIDVDDCTSQTAFFDQTREKRQHLLRSYQELIFYVPWKVSPDESFLNEQQRNSLNEDPERNQRYSLRRLQAFFKVYQAKWTETFRPPCSKSLDVQTRTRNEQWFRDMQFSFSMWLVNDQNCDLRLDRIANKGVLTATFDDADELQGTDVSIHPTLHTENDDADYPNVLNFCIPNEGFNEILHQPVPELSEIHVMFPLQHAWQSLEDMVRKDKVKMFMARPPPSPLNESQMTDMQRFAYECMLDEKIKIIYLVGKAGAGKSSVGLLACEKLKDRIQCSAGTGRAASIFNAPTIHSAMQWSLRESSDFSCHSANKITEMRTFYENTDIFLVDEVNALSAECLARMHETMTCIFNPDSKKNADGELLPFGGKKMIFMGDPAQLRPVMGAPIYETNVTVNSLRKKGASRQMMMNVKGQLLYRKYLLENTILLKKGQRNAGLLQIICDRLRDGEQTSEDLTKLTWLRRKFPEAGSDYGIHYDNDSCNVHNLRQLWNDCRSESPSRRLYVCKATYEDTGSNQSVIDGLACLPAKFFDYVPNMLCLSENCLVRLTKNINVGAGMVNGSIGRVMQILFNNADLQAVLDSRHPPPHCVIIELEGFQGFVLDSNKPDDRFFPIEGHRNWVPIYREKVRPNAINIPSWIRKKQNAYQCYRQQFPLDLAMHMTAHRSQGQTLSNVVVSADMNLDNPDKSTPVDIGSIIYVALTRVRNLVDLLVSPIFLTAWEKIGKSEMDDRRRKADSDLVKAAEKFAIKRGKLKEYKAELNFKANCGDIDAEWNEIKSMTAPPERKNAIGVPLSQSEALKIKFKIRVGGETTSHSLSLTPVLSERHLGIDQGRRNFAVVCIDKRANSLPKVVASALYDLDLSKKFKMMDLACALMERTDLMNWMQLEDTMLLEPVDRVVVHLEHMAMKHGNSREFTISLGKYLQSRAINMDTCIVKLSQANVHRRNGPMFKLGDEIVKSLSLTACNYQTKKKDFNRKRSAQNATVLSYACTCTEQVNYNCKATKHLKTVSDQQLTTEDVGMDADVENQTIVDDVSVVNEHLGSAKHDDEYTRKKKMSAAIYKYFVNANQEQQLEMGVEIDADVQSEGRNVISQLGPRAKLDDRGDALLHGLSELLCGSSHYRQLVPSSSPVSNNRTVVLAVLPHMTYWIVLNCHFNLFVLEDLGTYKSGVEGKFFRSAEVEKLILDRLNDNLRVALTDFSGSSLFQPIFDVKICVKQLQGLRKYALTRAQAGSLTQATHNAMKTLVDRSSAVDSKVFEKKDKTGCSYMRTDTVTGHTFHVLKSSGKHLNAVLSFLEFFKENANRVLDKRDTDLNQSEKLMFFKTLENLATQDEPRLEMMKLSQVAKAKLVSGVFKEDESKKLLADLILISINKNQTHVRAIAANYRANVKVKKPRVNESKPKRKAVEHNIAVVSNENIQQCIVNEPVREQFSDVEPDSE